MCHKNTGGCSNIQHGKCGHSNQNTISESNSNNNTTISNAYDENNTIINKNWVRNISKIPLTDAQECLLAHGPNVVIVPKEPPISEYIAATEKACLQLKLGKAEELRWEIKSIFKKTPNTKPNISKEEYQALKQMKKDNTKKIHTADKGVSMVVMDKEEYIQKSEELLQQPTYKILPTDSTTKVG